MTASPPPLPEAPRSLAEELREWTDGQLGALLRARPDLAAPLPADVGRLADRVMTTGSLLRALDRLDLFSLQVLHALTTAAPPPTLRDLYQRVPGAGEEALRDVVDRLRRMALVWGTDEQLRLPSVLGDLLLSEAGSGDERPSPEPPALDTVAHRPRDVDAGAGAHAFTAVRTVEELLATWGVSPPPTLRAGGLGVRQLHRTATELNTDDATAAVYLESAYAAGLLGLSDDFEPVWLPTPAYDAWLRQPFERRWVELVTAWLGSSRLAGLVGVRDDRDRPLVALGPDLDRPAAREERRGTLEALATLPPGTAASRASLVARLRWWRPRRTTRTGGLAVEWTLREAETLGLTGRGALSHAARALVGGDEAAAAAALAPLLPEPLDHVLLQADLTAVAPGPITTALAQELRLAADVESTGGATVYRFGPTSLRRALDAGRTAADLHALLDRHSRTPVPQPLRYLVDDVARQHGRVRVGSSSAYLRCEDPAVLDEVLADRRAQGLGLRRLAPTVIAAQVPVDVVLERLRAMGLAPAPESPEGALLVRRPDSRRTPPRRRPPRPIGATAPLPDRVLASAVAALRAGDRARAARRQLVGSGTPQGTTAAQTLAVLQQAAQDRRPVWISYVDDSGTPSDRVVETIQLTGGALTAYDHRRQAVRTFAVHRITGVARFEDTAEEDPGQVNTK
ncbi:helicase-associated domain-containing protein [soil metagenome]